MHAIINELIQNYDTDWQNMYFTRDKMMYNRHERACN